MALPICHQAFPVGDVANKRNGKDHVPIKTACGGFDRDPFSGWFTRGLDAMGEAIRRRPGKDVFMRHPGLVENRCNVVVILQTGIRHLINKRWCCMALCPSC